MELRNNAKGISYCLSMATLKILYPGYLTQLPHGVPRETVQVAYKMARYVAASRRFSLLTLWRLTTHIAVVPHR